MLILSALFLYTLKKMRNINIPSGRGIVLSGDRQRAGTFLGIARKRMFLMKQMMKAGNLQYMKRSYYLDRDCVWVRLWSIDGADFIRIHSCSEGGKCANDFDVANDGTEFTPFRTSFLAHHTDNDGKKVPADAFDSIEGWYLFDDVSPITTDDRTIIGAISRTEAFSSHSFTGGAGDKSCTFISVDKKEGRATVEKDSVVITNQVATISTDTTGFGGAQGFLSFSFNDGVTRNDATIVIDGEGIGKPYTVNTSSGVTVRHRTIATGERMTAVVTLFTPHSSDQWISRFFLPQIDRMFWTFTKNSCIARSTKTFTVPVVESE